MLLLFAVIPYALIHDDLSTLVEVRAVSQVRSNPQSNFTAVLAEDGGGMWSRNGNKIEIQSWDGDYSLQSQSLWIPYSKTEVGHRLVLTEDQWGTYSRLVREKNIQPIVPAKQKQLYANVFTIGQPVAGLSAERFLTEVPFRTGNPLKPWANLYAVIVPKSRPKFMNRTLFTSEKIGSAMAFHPISDDAGFLLGGAFTKTTKGRWKLAFSSWRYSGIQLRKMLTIDPSDPFHLLTGRSVVFAVPMPYGQAHLLFDRQHGRVIQHLDHERQKSGSPQLTTVFDLLTRMETRLPLPAGFTRFQPYVLNGKLLASAWKGVAFHNGSPIRAQDDQTSHTFLWGGGAWRDLGSFSLEATSATGSIGLFQDAQSHRNWIGRFQAK